MLLCNVLRVGEKDAKPKDILLQNGRIAAVVEPDTLSANTCLNFSGDIIFPGLINSHDHLDFNLFPQLKNRSYHNYREWGNDIHKQNKEQINAVLQVPQPLRTRLGLYKNLLNGFTTVVNHGSRLPVTNDLVTVHQLCTSLHSVGFENNWKWKLNRVRKHKHPLVIHVGEGIDETASTEIDTLIRWNLFRKPLVAVHGTAMSVKQAASFRSLVWCPVSNYFLLNQTAPINKLKAHVQVLFGSDSTLTAGWNTWDHLRIARQTGMMTDWQLFQTLTGSAADTWGLNSIGHIEKGFEADIVVAKRKKNLPTWDAFYETDAASILLVMHKGLVKLFDHSLLEQLSGGIALDEFDKITVHGETKYVTGGIPALIDAIRAKYPEADFSWM
jgi:cytosine/adenosine deaminase-related metal-dependent hydrolase